MVNFNEVQQELINNFNLFDTWMDKYEFLIDLGKTLPTFPEMYKQDQYKVQGCQSNVWIYHELQDNVMHLQAVSDSAIINGLIYLLLAVYNNRTPQEILTIKPVFIEKIGLDKHLSSTRKNGLHAMLQNIYSIAASK
jgi:cysteine desulfuration protein SufE